MAYGATPTAHVSLPEAEPVVWDAWVKAKPEIRKLVTAQRWDEACRLAAKDLASQFHDGLRRTDVDAQRVGKEEPKS